MLKNTKGTLYDTVGEESIMRKLEVETNGEKELHAPSSSK